MAGFQRQGMKMCGKRSGGNNLKKHAFSNYSWSGVPASEASLKMWGAVNQFNFETV